MILKQKHEYRWSNHSITTTSVGWGITATSGEADHKILKELEKLAAAMPIPPEAELTTEALSYSSVCGYVRLLARQDASGEDGRMNKCIQMTQYRAEDPGEWLPEIYLQREGWVGPDQYQSEEVSADSLKRIQVKELAGQLMEEDYLTLLFHHMMHSLLEKNQSLNIVIPGWTAEDFNAYTERLMLLFHRFLPFSLRPKAGYLSYTEEKTNAYEYYFSNRACNKTAIDLSKLSEFQEEFSPLEAYYLDRIMPHFLEEDAMFLTYQKMASDYVAEHGDDSNLYRKLQWLYYGLEAQNQAEKLHKSYLMQQLPELLFWGSKDEVFASMAEWIAEDIHGQLHSKEEVAAYISFLLGGMTQSAGNAVEKELHWAYKKLWKCDPKHCLEQFALLKEKNPRVYTDLLTSYYGEKESPEAAIYEPAMQSLSSIRAFLGTLEGDCMKRSFRDEVFAQGTMLLNEDVFNPDAYRLLNRIAEQLHHKKYWILSLKELLRQMGEQKEVLTNEQLDTACYIESQFNKMVRSGKSFVLMEEKKGRMPENESIPLDQKGHVPENEEMTSSDTDDLRMKENLTDEDSSADEIMTEVYAPGEETEQMSFRSYVFFGLPYGFLCGCAYFVGRYSMMIGHWKIALGMLGMMILFLMNYTYSLYQMKTGYAIWKSIGLVLLEGVIVKQLAFMNPFDNYRIIYFAVMGALCILVQSANLLRIIYRKKHGGE